MLSSFARRIVASGAVAVLAVAALAACTDSGPSNSSDPTASQGGAQASPGVHQFDLGSPMISVDLPVPASENDMVNVGVLALEVQGKLTVLHLVFTPNFTSVAQSKEVSLATMLGGHSLRPELIDTENLKIYSVVGSAVTSGYSSKTLNGQPMYVWATFAAPENDNATFDVRVDSAWPVFTDIPVSR